jgi:hypothetical protein
LYIVVALGLLQTYKLPVVGGKVCRRGSSRNHRRIGFHVGIGI